jgi:hypothetical protein
MKRIIRESKAWARSAWRKKEGFRVTKRFNAATNLLLDPSPDDAAEKECGKISFANFESLGHDLKGFQM